MSQGTEKTAVMLHEVALQALQPGLLDASACLGWLLQTIHGDRPSCPRCGREIDSEAARRTFWARGRVCCKGCGKFFDFRTGTILSGTTLSPREVYLLALLLAVGRPIREIADRLGLHEGTVRDWRDRMTITGLRVSEQQG